MRVTLLSVLLIWVAGSLDIANAQSPRCLQLGADGHFLPRACADHDRAQLAGLAGAGAKALESPVSFKLFGVGNAPSAVPVTQSDPTMQYAALFDSDPSPNPGCSPFDRAFIATSGSFVAPGSASKGTVSFTPGAFGCGLYVQSGCFDYVQSVDDSCFAFLTGGRSHLLIQAKPPFSAAFDQVGLGNPFAGSVTYSDGASVVASDLCTGLDGVSVGEVTRFCTVGDVNLQSPIDPALEDAVDLGRLEFDFGEFMGGPSEVQVNLSVAPNPVEVGQMFTLSWSAPDALTGASCLAGLGSPTPWSTLGAVENLGSVSYPAPTTPGTYFFGLSCEGPNSGFGSAGLELEVIASTTPSALKLTVYPAHTAPGAVISLNWNSTGVNSGMPCMPGPNWPVSGPLAASGSLSLAAPQSSVEYSLSCAGTAGPLVQSVQLQIAPQPPLPPVAASLLVSQTPSMIAADGASTQPRVSQRGEQVVYLSQASDLLSNPISGSHVYSYTGGAATQLISLDIQGNALPFASLDLALADQPFVRAAFATSDGLVRAVDLTSGLGLGPISSASGGALANGSSSQVDLSADGATAAFASAATNLVAAAPAGSHIYLKTGTAVELISRPAAGFANGPSHSPAISGDGSTVVFATDASNLGSSPPQGAQATQICLAGPFEITGRPRLCVSRNFVTGLPANAAAGGPRLSADGRYGVFDSAASNLVAGDSNGQSDVYWFSWDGRQLTGLVRISTGANGEQGNGASYGAMISADGDTVSFVSEASNLVAGDSNGAADVYIKHVRSGQIALATRAADGAPANAATAAADLSADASTVVYQSLANNLSALDQNSHADIYRASLPLKFDRDEPGLRQVQLPAPQPPNSNCPAGYFVAVVEDGPGPGVEPGIFGMELLLNPPGSRELAGGLNFGGLVDAAQVGFAGVNIANPTGELQRLEVLINGIPLSGATSGSYPVKVMLQRPQVDGPPETVLQLEGEIGLEQNLTGSVEVAPGYYLATVQALTGEAGGDAEGVFYFTLSSQFLDRPGGGFQGGAVVGGYHAANALGAPSGFAAFCIADPYRVNARVLARPSYGTSGARDLRLRLLDQSNQPIYQVPGY